MRPEPRAENAARTLALLDGDLPSLVMAGILAERAGGGGPRPLALVIGNGPQREAATTMAGVLGLGCCAAEAPAFLDGPTGLARGLLELAEIAIGARCHRVALPWVASVHGTGEAGATHQAAVEGSDEAGTIARLALWHDTALLTSRLLLVQGVEFEFELPLVDLEPAQLADLAIDMDLAPDLCWWARAGRSNHGDLLGKSEAAEACRVVWEPLLATMRAEG